MSKELQAESGGIDLDDDQVQEGEASQTETVESGAELAPVSGDDQNKNEESAQDKANKAINKQHAKFREQERIANAEKKRADEAEGKLKTLEAETGEIIIPPIPDQYDDDFDEKVKARDDAISRKATQDAQKAASVERQRETEEAANKEANARVLKSIEDYDARIITLGLNPAEIAAAGQKVSDYGISGELAQHILDQEEGPLITKYLADNPIQLDDLRNMTPIQAAFKIESEIKQAASLLKPQATQAPDPSEVLSGRGAGEQISPFIKGAKFE